MVVSFRKHCDGARGDDGFNFRHAGCWWVPARLPREDLESSKI